MLRETGYNCHLEWVGEAETEGDALQEEEEYGNDDNHVQMKKVRNHMRYNNV